MVMKIGSTSLSNLIQANLNRTSNELSETYKKLASGRRINSGKDDAAGLILSESLNGRKSINYKGVQNLNEGISAVTVAKSALESLANIVTRQMELAQQSANGTYSLAQRQAFNEEAKSLTDEYNRIVEETSYNGLKLLDGSFTSTTLQAGIGQHAIIPIGIGKELNRPIETVEAPNGGWVLSQTFTDGRLNGQVTLDDFNADGYLDAVTTADRASLRLGNGDGTFKTEQEIPDYSNGKNYGGTSSGDFNKDGLPDLVMASLQNTVEVLLNNGDGTFPMPQSFFSLPNVVTVNRESQPYVADIDADGNLDIAIGGRQGNAQIFWGNGQGGFASSTVITWGVEIPDIDIGDINGDGRLDLILTDANQGYGARQFYNNGNRTFTTGDFIAENGNRRGSNVGYLNQDTFLDRIVIYDQTNYGQAGISFGNGSSIPNPSVTISTSVLAGTPHAPYTRDIEIADLNGDGKVDLLTTSSVGVDNFASLSYGNGDGTFKAPFTVGPSSNNGYGISVGDINGDGFLDIVTGSNAFLSPGDTRYPNLLSPSSSQQALSKLSQMYDRVNAAIGSIDAIQARLDVAIKHLRTTVDLERDAYNRVVDIDIPVETKTLAQKQAIQQIGTSLLDKLTDDANIILSLLPRNI